MVGQVKKKAAKDRLSKAKSSRRDVRSLRCESLEQRQLLSISPGMLPPSETLYGPLLPETVVSEQMITSIASSSISIDVEILSAQTVETDTTPPVLLDTSIFSGTQLSPGTIRLDALFSEPLDETTLTTDVVQVVGQSTGSVAIDSISFDAETSLLTVTFDAPVEDLWTVTFLGGNSIEGNVLQDLAGNPMASDVSMWFTTETDLGGTVLDGQFERIGPLGTGALAWDVADTISHAVDRDSFIVTSDSGLLLNGPFGIPGDELDAFMLDQPTTLLIDPAETLQATLEVRDASGNLIASAQAAAPGEAISLSMPGMIEGELPYTITVGSLFGTTGEYTLKNLAWSSPEAEYVGGTSNDTDGTAEDINGEFLDVGLVNVDRAVIVGTAAEGDADWYRFSISSTDVPFSIALESDGDTPRHHALQHDGLLGTDRGRLE